MRTHVRRPWLVIAAPALAAILAACSSSGSGGANSSGAAGGGAASGKKVSTVTLGEVTDFSGAASAYGIPENQGAQIALDEINAAGGIKSLGGATLTIKKYDTASSPDNGPTQATKAVADKVAAIFGGEISDTVLAGINVTQRAGVAWVDAGGTADAIHKRGYDSVFQVAKNSTQFSQGWFDTAKLAASQLGISNPTMAIAYSQSSYGQDFLDAFEKANSGGDFKVVQKFGYPLGTSDFSSIAARLASTSADIIFNIGYPGDGLNLARLFATKFKTKAKVYIAGGSDAADVVKALHAQANGALVLGDVTPTTKNVSQKFKDFYSAYQSKYKAVPNTQALFGYECVQFLAQALEAAKSDAAADVVKALRSVTLTQDSGNIFPSPAELSFGDDGALKQAPVYAAQVQNGAAKVVFPAEVAEAQMQPYGA
jgi:branched-chain amino acid transport system substrate-binding protein